MLNESPLREVVDLLSKRLGLEALWVFGSAASGKSHARSDLDLAGLFRSPPDPVALLDAQSAVEAIVARDVDLVDLERASPILAFQVLKHGRVVHDGNPGRRVCFVAALIGRYEDVRRLRQPIERAAVRRITRGRA